MVKLFLRFYLGVSFTLIVCLTLVGFFFESQYEDALEREHQLITKALMVILDDRMCEFDESSWPGTIDDVSRKYSYNITLTTKDSLDKIVAARLRLNDFVVYVKSGFLKDVVELYYQSSCSSAVLKCIPSSDHNSFYNIAIGVTLAFVFVSFAIAVLFLAWPITRHINAMLRSLHSIANGEFSARADEHAPAPLDKMAEAINFVAQHISILMSEQQMLTNAASHELNTPLMRLNYSMELLLKKAPTTQEKEQISMMMDDLFQLQDLVVEILQYSKVQYKDISLELESISVLSLFEKIQKELSSISPTITIKIACNEGLTVDGCPKSIHRALTNLVRNAQKYASSFVELVAYEQDGKVNIDIVDDGCGIPDDLKLEAIKPFSRVDSSRNRDTGGAGLGLAIVERICKAHKASFCLLDNNYGGLTAKVIMSAEIY